MSAETDPFLALDVSTDDYATTAAHDQRVGADATVAAVQAEDDSDAEREKATAARAARTRYTEEDFLAQKSSYTARIDEGSGNGDSGTGKSKLDKKHHQTIQAAVSELYFLQKYAAVQEIITWAKEHFEKDKKWDAQVVKWEGKIKEKMQTV
ncbi:unnamed protein product [Aureobasidium pullulans]|nr:unnamed protein product [Aureobasidium pullulans]